jgi:hypothetical protein
MTEESEENEQEQEDDSQNKDRQISTSGVTTTDGVKVAKVTGAGDGKEDQKKKINKSN